MGGTSLFRLAAAADAPARFERLAQAGVLTRPFRDDPPCCASACRRPNDWARLEAALMESCTMSDDDDRNARHAEAMHALKAERDAMMREKREGQGLLMVHTGDGKGKSTAAFGMVGARLGLGPARRASSSTSRASGSPASASSSAASPTRCATR